MQHSNDKAGFSPNLELIKMLSTRFSVTVPFGSKYEIEYIYMYMYIYIISFQSSFASDVKWILQN